MKSRFQSAGCDLKLSSCTERVNVIRTRHKLVGIDFSSIFQVPIVLITTPRVTITPGCQSSRTKWFCHVPHHDTDHYARQIRTVQTPAQLFTSRVHAVRGSLHLQSRWGFTVLHRHQCKLLSIRTACMMMRIWMTRMKMKMRG